MPPPRSIKTRNDIGSYPCISEGRSSLDRRRPILGTQGRECPNRFISVHIGTHSRARSLIGTRRYTALQCGFGGCSPQRRLAGRSGFNHPPDSHHFWELVPKIRPKPVDALLPQFRTAFEIDRAATTLEVDEAKRIKNLTLAYVLGFPRARKKVGRAGRSEIPRDRDSAF